MKSIFILDLKVRFKRGVLSSLFYLNSTRLLPAGNSPRQPRKAAAGSPVGPFGAGRKGRRMDAGWCVLGEEGGGTGLSRTGAGLCAGLWLGDGSHFIGSYLMKTKWNTSYLLKIRSVDTYNRYFPAGFRIFTSSA